VDDSAYLEVNGVKLYSGPVDNSALTSPTNVQVGVIFSNTSTAYDVWIGNVLAKTKAALNIPAVNEYFTTSNVASFAQTMFVNNSALAVRNTLGLGTAATTASSDYLAASTINTFYGNDTEILERGQAASGSDAWFMFDLKSATDSTGITVSGSFAVYRGVTLLTDNVTVLHSNVGGRSKGLVTVGGLNGLAAGENLFLRSSSDGASIQFNF